VHVGVAAWEKEGVISLPKSFHALYFFATNKFAFESKGRILEASGSG
jgi:hypothetical protein